MYNEVVERLQSRLQGWKAKCLSLAGRVTLIKVVTLAIPSYVMQTASIPKGVCHQLDKYQWQFLWGSTDEKRRIHKVRCEKVCKPKIQ